ncbi:MAG: putative phage repressor [Gammaproteobacteria bacterium]|jgi:SOS-response transcriptional repressor LexA|nr:putative phage repressor [Gammaproteobacteria bacterium]
MSTFGYRIKKARLEAKLSQEALAEAMSQLGDKKKISRTAITQWETGRTKEIEAANLLNATKVLNVEPDWLQFGTGRMRPQIEMKPLDFFDNKICVVPALNCIPAVRLTGKNKEIFLRVGLDDQLAQIASLSSFALIIKDSSMLPLFSLGDLVIIDPTIQPSPGEFVAVKMKDQEAVVFRKYRFSSQGSLDQFELIALNKDWGEISIINKADVEIIGTLIEHRSKRRLMDLKIEC